MLTFRQISVIDHPSLIGSADLSIDLSPEQIAERLNLITERSFDDFGAYVFLALETDEGIIAFRRYDAKPDLYSYVSYEGISRDAARDLLLNLFPDDTLNILCTEDSW